MLKINHDKIGAEEAAQLMAICPFNALEYDGDRLSLNAGCKMCGLCVKKGPAGAMELVEDHKEAVNKDEWRGIAVYAQQHPVDKELLAKARDLAQVIDHPVYALIIGYQVQDYAEELLRFGADKVYVYDAPQYEHFLILPQTDAFSDFIRRIKPSSILVGGTQLGRSLAPRVAARFRTGMTADCTRLEMRENTDLVQIRPAFGGNIMAQIVTTANRPQFCTVRYKVFSALPAGETAGEIIPMEPLPPRGRTQVLAVEEKPKEVDIAEAEVIVAVGRGVKNKNDLPLIEALAQRLGAQMGCTRPLIEAGWFDAKRQIGLSGRTVAPKLLITVGVSGSVQFAAGVGGAERIIAINQDPGASIFNIAHNGFVGDLYKIIPEVTALLTEEE